MEEYVKADMQYNKEIKEKVIAQENVEKILSKEDPPIISKLNTCSENDKELSLDFDKELNSKYSERLTNMLNELSSKYNFHTNNTNKNVFTSENDLKVKIESTTTTNTINTNTHNIVNNNIYQAPLAVNKTIDYMKENSKVTNKVLSLHPSFCRLGRLRNARKEFVENNFKLMESQRIRDQKFKNRSNDIVLNEINYLFDLLDNIPTETLSSVADIKDNVLNSHQNFIAIKKFDDFKEGAPILKLKREEFLEKTKKYMNQRQLNVLDEIHSSKERKSNSKKKQQSPININNHTNNARNILMNLNNNNNKNKTGKFFSTELSEITEHHNNIQISDHNTNINNILSPKNKELNTNNSNTEELQKYPEKVLRLNHNFSQNIIKHGHVQEIILNNKSKKRKKNKKTNSGILPKISVREMSVDIIPERFNIYSKIKIKDIIGMAKIAKPLFK